MMHCRDLDGTQIGLPPISTPGGARQHSALAGITEYVRSSGHIVSDQREPQDLAPHYAARHLSSPNAT